MTNTTIVGLALIAFGIVWKIAVANRANHAHKAALAALDPAARISAARAAVSCGLDRTATLLVAHIRVETHQEVLDAIAHAVALRQWEPADRPAVTEIRVWSADRLLERGGAVRRFGPAVTRLADMGGPQREFHGNDGVTGDRTLDATIAEIRALCARVGVDHAELSVAGHRLTLEATSESAERIPGDVAQRIVHQVARHGAASGLLGGYDISVSAIASTDALAGSVAAATTAAVAETSGSSERPNINDNGDPRETTTLQTTEPRSTTSLIDQPHNQSPESDV